MSSPRRVTVYERWFKRGFDVVGAVALLVLLSPVMAAVAVVVWATLGSPVLFRQTRLTRDAREFQMLKFRTMRPDRRLEQQPFQGPDRRVSDKSRHDPRHTRLGRFLRQTSLDELPQLFNVLRGDMSLVGPRPERPHIAQRHGLVAHPRHTVRAGMTGPWQVSPYRPGAVHEHVDLDEDYVERLRLRTDAAIAASTVRAVLRRSGE